MCLNSPVLIYPPTLILRYWTFFCHISIMLWTAGTKGLFRIYFRRVWMNVRIDKSDKDGDDRPPLVRAGGGQ